MSTQESTYKKKYAFTLAEVLITLGIIGVVAAMTLPTLIQNYKDQVIVSQTKKTYSNFTNVLNLMKSQREVTDYRGIFATGETPDEIVQNIAKYYNGSIVCSDSSDRCGSAYDVKLAQLTNKVEEFGFPRIINSDGSSIYFRDVDEYACVVVEDINVHANGRCATVIIDANGQDKGPNQYGADVHQMVVSLEKVVPCGKNHNSENYGALDTIFLDNKLNYKK